MTSALFSPPAAPVCGRCPDHVLAELLALNEEMALQLRLERQSVAGTADFLTHMIGQHERAAALLRAHLATEDGEPCRAGRDQLHLP